MALTRHTLLAAALAMAAFALAHARAGQVDHRRVDDLDRAVGPVRAHPADVQKKTGIEVRVVALGTGQALDMGRRGDADVVFVHDRVAEEKFVAEGYGVERRDVMYNDFVLIGPKSDPAKVAGGKDVAAALKDDCGGEGAVRVARRQERHARRRAALWKDGGRRLERGQGHLVPRDRIRHGTGAQHRLVDERLHPRRSRHVAVVQEPRRARHRGRGRPALFNQYGVILVNPAKHAHVKKAQGQAFMDWLVSPEGQAAIASYKIGGEQLFFADAKR